eukprot:13578630-Alexandrium_andersonii.AAC.1
MCIRDSSTTSYTHASCVARPRRKAPRPLYDLAQKALKGLYDIVKKMPRPLQDLVQRCLELCAASYTATSTCVRP